MQKGHYLQFNCVGCHQPIPFSIFDLEQSPLLNCLCCSKKYAFSDLTLIRQIKKFEALCRQIHDSEEILGQTSVGIACGEHNIKVPYKLLLCRFSTSLDLKIGNHSVSILFRMEPLQDIH